MMTHHIVGLPDSVLFRVLFPLHKTSFHTPITRVHSLHSCINNGIILYRSCIYNLYLLLIKGNTCRKKNSKPYKRENASQLEGKRNTKRKTREDIFFNNNINTCKIQTWC